MFYKLLLSEDIIMKKNILLSAIVLLSVLQAGKLLSMNKFSKIIGTKKIFFSTKQLFTSQQRKFTNQNDNSSIFKQILKEQKRTNDLIEQQNEINKETLTLKKKSLKIKRLKLLQTVELVCQLHDHTTQINTIKEILKIIHDDDDNGNKNLEHNACVIN